MLKDIILAASLLGNANYSNFPSQTPSYSRPDLSARFSIKDAPLRRIDLVGFDVNIEPLMRAIDTFQTYNHYDFKKMEDEKEKKGIS